MKTKDKKILKKKHETVGIVKLPDDKELCKITKKDCKKL
jgi:hypothetical protein